MAFASGKAILFGEHAVLHGEPAVAAGLDRGAHAQVTPAAQPSLRVGGGTVGAEADRALEALLARIGSPPVHVSVDLSLPPGCGLGASAAIGVAIARALLPNSEPRLVIAAAMEWERIFHGNPSGIDVWAAALGGCIAYVRGSDPTPIHLPRPLHLAIALAGPPASTRQMVDQVAALDAAHPDRTRRIFRRIGAITEEAKRSLGSGRVADLGPLLDENQRLLVDLEVSTPDLDRACAVARSAGALGAKLTGAGGGGSVLALVEEDAAPVLEAWHAVGIPGFATRVGGAE
jgi:mevalonate kinase